MRDLTIVRLDNTSLGGTSVCVYTVPPPPLPGDYLRGRVAYELSGWNFVCVYTVPPPPLPGDYPRGRVTYELLGWNLRVCLHRSRPPPRRLSSGESHIRTAWLLDPFLFLTLAESCAKKDP